LASPSDAMLSMKKIILYTSHSNKVKYHSLFIRHLEIHLDSKNPKVVVIPPGCVHGYLTVKSETEILYVMSTPYEAINEIGVRFDDPKLGLKLPKSPIDVSQKDLNWPLL
jgi:dTDP-4-dehydrorhamnose 3,5-epimerase